MNATACAPLVEAGDPDRFLTVMAAPMPLRPRLWPLYAYNLEIARAPWASSEPMVAEMRLQWWIDTVEAMGRGTLRPGHEVTDGLAPLIAATEGLAPLMVKEIWKVIRTIRDSGIATVVVDKNHSAVTALTNRSMILVKGEVVFDGPSEQVRQDPALIRKHLGV